MQCCVPRCRNRSHRGRPAECRCAGPRDWLSHQWKRVTDMLPGRKRRMAAGNTRDLEKDSPDCLSPCETTGQVPQTGKEAEPSLEAYMALQVSQDNMGVPDAQGRRQPPPKPPRRNKGRVIWYSGSCPYSDWPPLLEDQPQVGPGPQEPEGELQPVQQMTTGDTLDTGEDMPCGLIPPNTEEQMQPTSKEAESPLEASVTLLSPQDNMGALWPRKCSSPLPSLLAGTRAELSENNPWEWEVDPDPRSLQRSCNLCST
ncbi:uncharacterized protein LOC132533191 [Erinaceus europaeus]|uniref:Uncharacterized protein LOC132533191 n=1 Tax=Erinaceus europaeus TaxID=9365 RepID=A0ABM3W0H3_ERIEU|nr:uncharacterized protein LOC132533191 [Erinaceus europaeus]